MNSWLPYTDEQPRHGPRWMNIQRKERGQYPRVDANFLPMPCQHCKDAPCVKANPGCVSKRADGVVLIDPVKAKGKKEVVGSCPYGAIYWNEEKGVPQKCTFCAHILDHKGETGIGMPRCAHSCPTGAIKYFLLEPAEMAKKAAAEKLEHYQPELSGGGNVYYKNLYRFTKLFIAGGLLKNGDCLEGAKVSLKGDETRPVQVTNYFGDFKFDDLKPGNYTVVVDGKDAKTVKISESVNLGSLTL
jgi:Fe-S-cluster-containing dehydrogenase component